MQPNPFDRDAREQRLADLALEHEHINHMISEFQYALEARDLAQICIKRETLKSALRSHMKDSDLNASIRLLEAIHNGTDAAQNTGMVR
jgi:hypothetical protein